MLLTRRALIAAGVCALATPTFAQAKGARVTAVQVIKGRRRLELLAGSKIVKSYPVHLGKEPQGHKRFEGDNRTPEGVYLIDGRIPQSGFFKSLAISYPNINDLRFAQKYRKSPGGDICIHGQPNGVRRPLAGDWTAGCVALSNDDMDEVYRYVPIGTQIRIFG